jgi:SPP1 gp7 family putative phage head morphogenesis protein
MYGGLLSEWVQGIADGRFARIRNEIRQGEFVGEDADVIVRRLRGTRSANYRDGVLEISRRSVKGMVGTVFNHVANRARHTLYRENMDVIDGVMFSSILDDATCDECAGLDGEIYTFDEAVVIEESTTGPLDQDCRGTLS